MILTYCFYAKFIEIAIDFTYLLFTIGFAKFVFKIDKHLCCEWKSVIDTSQKLSSEDDNEPLLFEMFK